VSFVLVIAINNSEQICLLQIELFAFGNGVFAVNSIKYALCIIPKTYICNNRGNHIRTLVLKLLNNNIANCLKEATEDM
jgi:hypothetical protein